MPLDKETEATVWANDWRVCNKKSTEERTTANMRRCHRMNSAKVWKRRLKAGPAVYILFIIIYLSHHLAVGINTGKICDR